MPGVLFLDFDGPIFPQKVFLYPENNGELSISKCAELNLHPYVNYWKADPNAILMLNKLYEIYPYDLVISSSWADPWLHEKEQIVNLLDANKLIYNLHEEWKTPRDKYHTRHEQISDWLKKNPKYMTNYIVLDDYSSGDLLSNRETLLDYNLNPQNIFLVDVDDGIAYKQYRLIYQKLLTW